MFGADRYICRLQPYPNYTSTLMRQHHNPLGAFKGKTNVPKLKKKKRQEKRRDECSVGHTRQNQPHAAKAASCITAGARGLRRKYKKTQRKGPSGTTRTQRHGDTSRTHCLLHILLGRLPMSHSSSFFFLLFFSRGGDGVVISGFPKA